MAENETSKCSHDFVIYFQVTKAEALLTIPKCKRSDTGRYTGRFTNSSGSADVLVKVTVLGE